MTPRFEEEIAANLKRAEEALEAARTLLEHDHADSAASRAYYAAFYAATAALLNKGVQYSKHSGVLSAIHRDFVKCGRLDRSFGKSLSWLFELRNVGDYGETEHVAPSEAARAVQEAAAFIEAIGDFS